ncbi:hypothetical protein ACFPM3_20375 [Streptomyces coeruleoprunus]|uniref:Uncharacterized protein n=1 Tax=Streptomyces coeruleoprunus TaxID=285563 RepID=A0ABV9XJ18_9ACTN
MEIKILIDEITLDTVVGDVIRYDEDGDAYCDGKATVADKVAELIKDAVAKTPEYTSLRERVTSIRTEEIRAAVKPVIQEALKRPIQRTNYYGEATGKETTLSEIIMDEAKKTFTEVRDSYRNKRPFINEVVQAEVQKAFGTYIQDEVKKAREAVAAELGSKVSATVAQSVLDALTKGEKHD